MKLIELYRKLHKVLSQILKGLEEGQFHHLKDLLEQRTRLMEILSSAAPSPEEADEIAALLSESIAVEQAIVDVATRQRESIIAEMQGLRKKKKAFSAYGAQSLEGARP